MEYVIESILNKNGESVCSEYTNKPIDYDNCIIAEGFLLSIVFKDGTSFTHEQILEVHDWLDDSIIIRTTKKIWKITRGYYKKIW